MPDSVVKIPDLVVRQFEKSVAGLPMIVFATVSGSHMFGFPSVDSDYDIRGMHVERPRDILGLDTPSETRDSLDGLYDFTSHAAKKFLRLLCKNGNVLEQLWSPYVVLTSPEHDELKGLSLNCLTSKHAEHYRGFADAQHHMFEQRKVYEIKPTSLHLPHLHGGHSSTSRARGGIRYHRSQPRA